MPAGIRLVIGRRLQRLSEQARQVLAAAAVIGRHFELDWLEEVAGVDIDTLIGALEEAEHASLIKAPSGRRERRWRFANQLICQTLAGSLSSVRRQRLHLRLADAMARRDSTSPTHISAIAHHLYNAGALADATRTARALMVAGNVAFDVYATDEAIRHYEGALEILEETGVQSEERLDIQERLAWALGLVGERAAAMQHYRQLSAAYETAGRLADQARIARKMGGLHWEAGDRAAAGACYERAGTLLDDRVDHLELAQLYQERGRTAFRSGDNQRAVACAERALRHAEAALDAPDGRDARREAVAATAHARNTIGVALARTGQLEEARRHIEQSVATALEEGLADVACRGYANLGVLYSTVEPPRAIEVSLAGLELARKIGALSFQSHIYANLAAAYCALTDRCETEGLVAVKAAIDLDRELRQVDHLAVSLIVLAQIHQCEGQLQQAQEVYYEALALAEKTGEPQMLFPCYDGLATICLDRGDTGRAEQYMEKARQVCERAGVDPDALVLLPFLG